MSNNYTETELQLILNKITSAQASTITMNEGELYLAPDTAVYSVNNITPTNGNVNVPEGANKDLSNLSSTGNAKFQAPITGGASTITSSNLTTNRALVSNSSGKIAVSSVTLSELGYVSGVTSKIQTQLNGKVASNSAITGATKCKITYDSKGLVTSGTNLSASDIPDLSSTYYLASNPNGYTSNEGTVTSVNNISPDENGNVSLTIPTVNVDDIQINGTSIVSSKTANIITNTAYNASSNKIATMSDLSGFLTNNGTGTNSLALMGTATGNRGVGLGQAAEGGGSYATGLGTGAKATGDYAIQIGYGTNSTASTLSVGFNASSSANRKNWQLLDGATGLIPDARLSTNIAKTSDIKNSTITITQGGVTKGSFTLNQSSGDTIALDAGGGGSSRNIGEIVTSTIPLTDAGLHL